MMVSLSLAMPITTRIYDFGEFLAFFEGLLPGGVQLEALLRKYKIDKDDLFSQLILVGNDLIGVLTIEELISSTVRLHMNVLTIIQIILNREYLYLPPN